MNNTSSYESTSLVEAIRMKRFDEVKRFLQQGADVNKPDTYLTSPLQYLVGFDLLEWVQLFLEEGANPNYIDPYRETPVSCAISDGSVNDAEREAARLKIIPLLIANGGDLTIKNHDNERIIDLASEPERALIKKQLFKNAVYTQLMNPFEGEDMAHGVIWALLMPSITLFSIMLNKGDGTVTASQDSAQRTEHNKVYYLPKEIWIKIFSWALSDQLTHKPALLHLLPYKDRHIDTVERSFNHVLGNLPSITTKEVKAAARTELEDEWNELMRPTL